MDNHPGPIHDPVSLPKYLYAVADPTNIDDPSGHVGEADDTLAASAIGEFVETGVSLVIRSTAIAYRVATIAFRVAQFWPALAVGATVASSVLQAGASYMSQVAQRWSELQTVPSGAFGFSRGNFLHQQANSNLGPYFPEIDDFRNGFATSIKTTAADTPDALLSNIRGYLQQLSGVETRQLTGNDSNGLPITIDPGQIQAKGLLVAIPASSESIARDPSFATAVQDLADEFGTAVRIVPVDAFEE